MESPSPTAARRERRHGLTSSPPPATTAARVHYAWYILGASVVIELFGLGFGIFTITTMYPYITEAFPSWSRTTVFLPTSIIIAIAGCMAPVTGWLIDRYPIRVVFAVGTVLQAIALLLFGRVESQAQYLTAAALLGFGLSGVTVLPNQVLVSRWFHDRVGLVNGIVLAATALGASIAPLIVTRVAEATDWRMAFNYIAGLALVPPLLATLFVVRDRPAACGMLPYGAGAERSPTRRRGERAALHPGPADGLTLRAAVRVPVFWALMGVIFLGGVPCYSFNKHIMLLLKEMGYSTVAAGDMKSLYFFIAGCARFTFGWSSDHFDRRRTMLVHLGCLAFGYPLILLVPHTPALLVPCLVVVGIGYGGLLPTIPIMTVELFGRAHLGSLLGVYKIPYDIAAAGAPLLTAYLYDLTGGYPVPERLNATCGLIGFAIALAFVRRPAAPPAGATVSA
jgi:MFS transporter, OFA family, oxalate/formate antiporter